MSCNTMIYHIIQHAITYVMLCYTHYQIICYVINITSCYIYIYIYIINLCCVMLLLMLCYDISYYITCYYVLSYGLGHPVQQAGIQEVGALASRDVTSYLMYYECKYICVSSLLLLLVLRLSLLLSLL